ncbi:MAG TPA: hypothetical protein VGD56_11160 [Gemmatirosa sp.]
MPRPRRVELSTVLSWIAIVATVAALLAEGIGLRDAGERLRAQEAQEAREAAQHAGRGAPVHAP